MATLASCALGNRSRDPHHDPIGRCRSTCEAVLRSTELDRINGPVQDSRAASVRNSYVPLPERLFCEDSLQFQSVTQVCGDAPTAREFLAVCAQQGAVSVGCLLCSS